MAALSLHLLGETRIILDGQQLKDFRSNKVQALLLYLVAEPDSAHRREQLMTLLWPGMPERSARHNLRNVLYHLRQSIPDLASKPASEIAETGEVPLLIPTRQTIQINPAADVEADVYNFEAFIDSAQGHDHLELLTCHECRAQLEKAVAIYEGDFLTDFYLADSETFEEWAHARREHYRRKVLDVLETLTTITMRQKDYAGARTYAERQLEIDNLRESAYRQLMSILALSGQRSEAMSVYETCRRLLREELGMAPSTRTTEIYEQIQAGDLSFDKAPAQAVRGYNLKETIGEGAYGVIHKAIQPVVGREVAVKVIRRKYANDPEFIRRFEAEAQTVARLEHPYIVPLYDYWRDPAGAYLVMRYLRGGNLLTSLEDGPWDAESTLRMLDQITLALAAAHRQGVVHRDIKPANILLDESGNAYLSDFGIAKNLTGEVHMTADGAVIGTPDYISPEQILDDPVSPQSDIYSLGAVLYETLTGEKPFPDSSVANLIYKHLNEPVPLVSASRPDLSPQIDEVIQKATAKSPVNRYADALVMAEDFRLALGGSEVTAGIISRSPKPLVSEIYNPFKGLRAFQEADADDFFGRAALIDQLVARLADSRFIALVGPSGSGKSSVVKAGLIPALRQGAIKHSEKWFVAEMVPGSHPLEELELALLPIAVDPPPSLVEPMQRDKRGLLHTIRRILPDEEDAELVLVIDQFEELFTLVEDEGRRAYFLDSLLQAITATRSPLRVIITLRADFYDRPLGLQPLGGWIKDNTEVILPMAAEELIWAIQEPARRVGVGLEEGLATAILADIADEPGALPLLQYGLTELFDERQNGLMTRESYADIGGILGALGQRAEELYLGFDDASREATRQLFLRLVTLGEGVEDTRRRVLRSELAALGGSGHWLLDSDQQPATGAQQPRPNPQSPIPGVIDAFGQARLLTFDHDPVTRGPTIEVAHEALLREWGRLRRWLDESRADIRLQRLLAASAAEWRSAGRDPGFLLHGSRLEQFEGWSQETGLALTQDELDYLTASLSARQERQAEEEARRRRELETARQLAETEKARAEAEQQRAEEHAQAARGFRRRAYVLAGVLVVAVLLAAAAFFFARQSNDNAQTAQENADLAAASEAEALDAKATSDANAALAATRQVEAEDNAQLAIEALSTADVAALTEAAAAEEARDQQAIAEQERKIAQEQADLARSRELAAAALLSLDDDPERSILLAMQALSQTHTVQAEEALRQAIDTSRVRQTLYPPDGFPTSFVTSNPDGSRIFASGPNGGTLWDVATGGVVYTRTVVGAFDYPPGTVTEEWINRADFSPDGALLVLPNEQWAGDDPITGTITILEAESGEELITFPAHDYWVQEVSFNPEGTQFASAGGEGTIKVWDVADTIANGAGQEVAGLCCHEGWIWSIAYSPDGTRLASTSDDANLRMWDIAAEDELFSVNVDTRDVEFSPDGQYLAVGTGGTIQILDSAQGNIRATIPGAHRLIVEAVAFSPDGTWLGTASQDRTAKIWDYADGQVEPNPLVLAGHKAQVGSLSFMGDGRHVVTGVFSRFPERTVRIWDVSARNGNEFGLNAHNELVKEIDFSPDGSRLATASWDGTAVVWDMVTEQALFPLVGHSARVMDIEYSPDGALLATASTDGTAMIWDAGSGEMLLTLDAHGEGIVGNSFEGVLEVAFSPDGARLATAGADGTARLWDLATGQELLVLEGHTAGLTNVVFSPDGRLLATASDNTSPDYLDGSVRIWDAETGGALFSLSPDHGNRVWGLGFSPDGTLLATSGQDTTVKIWQLDLSSNSGHLLATLTGHSGTVDDVRFQSDGRVLATIGGGEAKLWDLSAVISSSPQSGLLETVPSELLSVPGDSGLALSPDGKTLVAGFIDGSFRSYTLDLKELLALADKRLTRNLTAEECRRFRVEPCPDAGETG